MRTRDTRLRSLVCHHCDSVRVEMCWRAGNPCPSPKSSRVGWLSAIGDTPSEGESRRAWEPYMWSPAFPTSEITVANVQKPPSRGPG